MTATPQLTLHIGDDYLEIQNVDMGNLQMKYPNVHDKNLAKLIVNAANYHDEFVEVLKSCIIVAEAGFGKPTTITKAQAINYIEKIKRGKEFLAKVGA